MSDTSQRYQPLLRLAAGGMATVYVGAAYGSLGFRQLVALKRPHPHLLEDPSYRAELLAEARLASMLRHANIVDVRDIDASGPHVQLIMDYVEGVSVGELLLHHAHNDQRLPIPVVIRVVLDVLAGLQAAHDLIDERGAHVGLIHRDISPQNVLVGLDGVARVTDFGVAKSARGDVPSTTGDALKGKIAYMAPEYVRGGVLDPRADLFAVGVLLWEMLAGRRLFRGAHDGDTLHKLLNEDPPSLVGAVPPALDALVQMALAKQPERRFQSANAMAGALEEVMVESRAYAAPRVVAAEVSSSFGAQLAERREKIAHALEEFLVASSIPHDLAQMRAMTLPLAPPAQPSPANARPPVTADLAAPVARTLLEAGHASPAPASPAGARGDVTLLSESTASTRRRQDTPIGRDESPTVTTREASEPLPAIAVNRSRLVPLVLALTLVGVGVAAAIGWRTHEAAVGAPLEGSADGSAHVNDGEASRDDAQAPAASTALPVVPSNPPALSARPASTRAQGEPHRPVHEPAPSKPKPPVVPKNPYD